MNLNSSEAISVALIIGGGVLYHLCQKSTPVALDPFLALCISFGLASLACLGISFARHSVSTGQLHRVNWASIALALALVGIESGYLIGYRSGLKLNITSFACNTLIALVLLGVGTFLYRESFTLRNASGMVLCAIGLLLLR
jgi:drug/metabolite transporter (DMT)-like permease